MKSGDEERARHRFGVYAWAVLGYNILVILWGTVVRATGSGEGCGEHWPLCKGVLIPHASQIATVIEFAHRASSGVAVVLVVGLVWLAFRRFAKGQAVRRYAAAALLFTFMEGLLGAALVLFGETGGKGSFRLASILSLHLVNTFLLLASLAMTAWTARKVWTANAEHPTGDGAATAQWTAYGAALAGTLVLAVTGTIAALADTLYPAATPLQGLRWDFSATASPLLHLRIIHPALAVIVGGYLLILAANALHKSVSSQAEWLARGLIVLVALQFCFGALNIILLTPVWMQATHLLDADVIWITLVLLSAETVLRNRQFTLETERIGAPAADSAASS